jgi:hypothetical protein
MKFIAGVVCFAFGIFFIVLGGLLIVESGRRYIRFRKAVRMLRNKEAQMGFEIGKIQ